ncbi:serine/threonine protein kinase [Streptomyces sp. AD2-2]|nr:serine/threonine protein kinase [Streptomyces sp. AD2-2]
MGTEGDNARVIAGRYRLEKRLGRGGMGVVWRAADQLLGRQVAVKEIAQDDSLSEEEARQQRDRTLREARAVAQLRHPHIIVVHDVVEQDERPYIVMELVDGGSLAERISARGPVDAAEAARIGIALLGALRTAHAAGVLHRDIKPANVLLQTATDEDGPERVVLTDFGIAQVAGATTLTESGAFVGSPEYTAPERMSGVRTGPESDLWSLGALLCTVLSGESPFRRDSLGGILHAVVVDEIRPPEQARPLLPVIRGLLERDPERRLEAAEAERMLRAFLDTGRTPKAAGASTGRHPRATSGHPGRPTPDTPRPNGTFPDGIWCHPRHPSPFARILYRRADLSAFHARGARGRVAGRGAGGGRGVGGGAVDAGERQQRGSGTHEFGAADVRERRHAVTVAQALDPGRHPHHARGECRYAQHPDRALRLPHRP